MTRSPSSSPSPKKPPQKKPPAWSMGLLLLIPAALGAALYLDSLPGKPYIPPASAERPAPSAVPATKLKALEQRITELERKYDALASMPTSAQTAITSPPSLEETTAAQEPPISSEDFMTLKNELEQLKTQMSEESPWKNEQLVALYRLERQLRAGKPYGKALDVLLENPGLPERVHMKLEPLTTSAPEGIATLSQLMRVFEENYETYLSGASSSPEVEGSAWDQITHNLSSLVTIRKIGDTGGDGDHARLARAQAYLAEDELTPAISEISGISDEAQPYFEEWLRQARIRRKALLTVERARSMLEEEGRRSVPAQGPGSV